MTTKTKPAAYRSGWCGSGQHGRCLGRYANCDCICVCHRTCPRCGQTLPESPGTAG